MKRKLLIVLFILLSTSVFSWDIIAKKTGSLKEYREDLTRINPYADTLENGEKGPIEYLRSYDVHTIPKKSYSVGIQAFSYDIYGYDYDDAVDTNRFGILDSIAPIMITNTWKQKTYLEWIMDPETGQTKELLKYSKVLWASSFGVIIKYDGENNSQFQAGAVVVPWQFSSANYTVGLGLQVLHDSEADDKFLVSVVIPFAYHLNKKTQRSLRRTDVLGLAEEDRTEDEGDKNNNEPSE